MKPTKIIGRSRVKSRTYFLESCRPPYPITGTCHKWHTEVPLNVNHLAATMTGVVAVKASNKDEVIALLVEKLCGFDVPVSVVYGMPDRKLCTGCQDPEVKQLSGRKLREIADKIRTTNY